MIVTVLLFAALCVGFFAMGWCLCAARVYRAMADGWMEMRNIVLRRAQQEGPLIRPEDIIRSFDRRIHAAAQPWKTQPWKGQS